MISNEIGVRALPIRVGLPQNFLAEEVRCGFVVTSKVKKIWAVELDLLSELLRVCNKYDIKVFAYAGTLLGAVRHSGFIPWDDDLDVAMSRDDWQKLCKVAPGEFSYPYYFQTAETDSEYYTPYARLRNSETTGVIQSASSSTYNGGIYIDVFPLDGYAGNGVLRFLHRKLLKIVTKCCTSYPGTKSQCRGYRKMISMLLGALVVLLPRRFWLRLHDKVSSIWNNRAKMLGLVSSFEFGDRYKIDKTSIRNLTLMNFENIEVPVPVEFKKTLEGMYGNYMEFPPASERGVWHNGKIVFEPDIPYAEYYRKLK